MSRARWRGRWGGEDRPRPLVIAHRGATERATENTLAAFAAAREGGADGVELDVQLSRDGEVVVFHDEDLERLAGRAGCVAQLDWSELAGVELEGGGRIPRLDQALEVAAPLLVNVEIKPPGRRRIETVRRVVECVARAGAGERVLVSSFDPAVVALVGLTSRLRTGLLCHAGQRRPLREAWLARAVRCDAVHPEHVLVTAERLARWHRAGYAVHTWTVNRAEDVRRLTALGVDALIGDRLTSQEANRSA